MKTVLLFITLIARLVLASADNQKSIEDEQIFEFNQSDSLVYHIYFDCYVHLVIKIKEGGEEQVYLKYMIQRVSKFSYNIFRNDYIEKTKRDSYTMIEKIKQGRDYNNLTWVCGIIDSLLSVKYNPANCEKIIAESYPYFKVTKVCDSSIEEMKIPLCMGLENNFDRFGFDVVLYIDKKFLVEKRFLEFFKNLPYGGYSTDGYLNYWHNKNRFAFRISYLK